MNHIDGHGALTTKDQLFLNMKSYCERKQINVYDIIPLTFAVDFLSDNQVQKMDQIAQVIQFFEKNILLGVDELNQRLQSL